MTDAFATGSIFIDETTQSGALMLPNGPDSNGWAAVKNAGPIFEKEVREAGWTYFFMAGEMKTTVFGFDRQKTLHTALGRLIANAKSQRCNSLEITQVAGKSFLRMPYVSVSAHPRHLQKGLVFSG